ncbi:Leucine-rich repeat-containing protein 4C [Blomia tropicalis]|nr:Leucine-rich repeat-containing protein 4C [Blomia tropicalis]
MASRFIDYRRFIPIGCGKLSSTYHHRMRFIMSDIWHVSHSIVSYLCSVDNRVESANFTTQISSSRCSSFHSSSLSIVSIPSALAASSSMSESSPSVNCPVVCSCIWKSGKQTATCDKRNLISVPVGLAATTQVIDLSGNSLNVLPPNVFLDRGIINLQRISLVDCNLVDISAESFVKLSNLIELDLANNSLTTIPSKSFAECAALRRLSLSGNRIREVRSAAFLSLARLNVLDLSNNMIFHLDTDAFRGLRSLQILKLEANQLQTLPAAESFVQFLPLKMAALGLHDNRWRCDCHLKPIREWIAHNNVPLPVKPVCSAPARLQGEKWDAISSHEFSCPPQIHTASSHFYKHIGNNVTITCPVTGYPQPAIFWLFEITSTNEAQIFDSHISNEIPQSIKLTNRTKTVGRAAATATAIGEDKSTTMSTTESSEMLVTPEGYHSVHKTNGLEQKLPDLRYSVTQEMENSHQLISTLTIHSLQPIDTQRITCFARNIGGSAMKNFSLVVSTQEPFSSSRSMDFIVAEMFVIFVSIAFLLLILFIFVAIFIAKFKKRPNSHVHAANNDLTVLTHSHIHNRHLHDESGDVANMQLKPHGDIVNYSDIIHKNKDILHDRPGGDPIGSVQYSAATNGVHVSSDHLTGPVLMVNTIDMIQSAIEYQKASVMAGAVQYASGPNSADLSSQSTTATSMTMNSGGAGPMMGQSQNGLTTMANENSPNESSDSSASVYYNGSPSCVTSSSIVESSINGKGTNIINYGNNNESSSTNSTCLSMTPDLLAKAQTINGYYLDACGNLMAASRVNICDYTQPRVATAVSASASSGAISHPPDQFYQQQSAYPLLNTTQLLESSGELIYGTRIAPTRLAPPPSGGTISTSISCHGDLTNFSYPNASSVIKSNKVKFADQIEGNQSDVTQLNANTDSSNKIAYTYATLRKPHFHSSNSSTSSSTESSEQQQQQQHQLRPINRIFHRNVASYPDGFGSLLVESSVDSFEPMTPECRHAPMSSGNVSNGMVASMCHKGTKPINGSTTKDSLDEAEEDDYYRILSGQIEQETIKQDNS